MTTVLYWLFGLVAVAGLVRAVWVWVRARGTRVISCPETHQPAAVELDSKDAALSGLVGRPHLQLSDCSRWPEKRGCDQACLAQIESAPDGCLLGSIVREWYEGRECVFCAKRFSDIHWHDHKPGMRAPQGDLLEWHQIEAARVFDLMKTHGPVCWDCLIAESFRRRFPERVVDAPGTPHAH